MLFLELVDHLCMDGAPFEAIMCSLWMGLHPANALIR
jgi:hypothetical protein